MTGGDELLRSYAILSSLKSNLPEGYEVEEKWAIEFNSAVHRIEQAMGISLAEFRLPQEELYRSVASSNYLSGEVTYRKGLWCQRSALMQKIDSILLYFTGLQSGKERRIGFTSSGE